MVIEEFKLYRKIEDKKLVVEVVEVSRGFVRYRYLVSGSSYTTSISYFVENFTRG